MIETNNSQWADFSGIIPQQLIKSLQENGFQRPTEIQSLTLKNYSHNTNFIIASQTGTGKTLSFGIPMICEILNQEKEDTFCQGLIITPTRELALQIEQQIKLISQPFYPKINCCSIVGGFSSQKQERLLNRNPSIIVSTPGRLWELIETQPDLFHNFSSLNMICLDEADRMIQLGHFKELGSILQFIMKRQGVEFVSQEDRIAIEQFMAATGEEDKDSVLPIENTVGKKKWKKVFFVSATFGSWFGDEKVRRNKKKQKGKKGKNNKNQQETEIESKKLQFLMKQLHLTKAPMALVGKQDMDSQQTLPENIVVFKVYCPLKSKLGNLQEIVNKEKEIGGVIIFCSRISSCRKLSSALSLLGINNANLHSKLQQRVRIFRWERFCSQQFKVLVCTDLGARGLDVPQGLVKAVVHWELPMNVEALIHRSGRTGRMGTEGNVYLLIEGLDDKKKWKGLERRSGIIASKFNAVTNSDVESVWEQVGQIEKKENTAREGDKELKKAQALGVEIGVPKKSQSFKIPVQSKKIVKQKQKLKNRNFYFNQEEIDKYRKVVQDEQAKRTEHKQERPNKKINKKLKKERQKLLKQLIR